MRTVSRLQRALLRWYARNARPLWWRQQPMDPYQVLVVEVMLQQTQVDRVQRLAPLFLQRFPTLESLAVARLADVLQAWQGLGYNRRARHLWECARIVVARYGGQLPSEPEKLRRLPGVGPYTAAAVATFAFGRQDVPVVDTNVDRVLRRLLGLHGASSRQIEQRARELIPTGYSVQWHQGLMDLGALYCHRRQPQCMRCPLRRWCLSAGQGGEGSRRATSEPCFEGVPRRLWRGQLLRAVAATGELCWEEAAQALFGLQPTAHQRAWLREVAASLCRDGLLCCRDDRLCLPD